MLRGDHGDLRRGRHPDDGQDDGPRHVDPDLEAEQARDREGVHREGPVALIEVALASPISAGPCAAARASAADTRIVAMATTIPASTMHTAPDDDRRLLPELEREELDQPLGGRIERVRATGEEDLMEGLEQRVERDERHDPAQDQHGDQAQRPAEHGHPALGPLGAASADDDEERERRQRQPRPRRSR